MPRSPGRRWFMGFVVGAAAGISIVGGPLSLVLAFVAVVLIGRESRRDAPMGGLFVGFGLAWIALFGMAAARCGVGCSGPDTAPWFAAAAAALLLGLIMSIRAIRAIRAAAR